MIDAIVTAAGADTDMSVRLMAVRALGTWLPAHPELRKRLEALVQKEKDPNVLLTIGAVLDAKTD